MDLSGGFRRRRPLRDRPSAALVRPRRQKRQQTEKRKGRLDQPVETGLLEAQRLQELFRLVGGKLRDLRLHAGGNRNDLRAFFRGERFDLLHEWILRLRRRRLILGHVRHIEHGLHRQEVQVAEQQALIVRQLRLARGLRVSQECRDLLQYSLLGFRFLVAALRQLLRFYEAFFHRVEISEAKLRRDDLDVADWIDGALDVRNIRVLKAAHHMRDGIHLPDMLEELVAEPFAFRRAAHQPRDVDEPHRRRRRFFRLIHLMQNAEPRVRHVHHADVRLDRAERIIRGLRPRFRDRVEKRALADVRQPDDSYL